MEAKVFRYLWAQVKIATASFFGYKVLVSPEVLNARLDVCEACPERDPETEVCRVCKCHTYAKAAVATEKCPKRKWLAIWRRKSH